MTWRVARSLERLRAQVNERFPGRNKSADGTIGDAAHARRGKASDHNPWIKIRENDREVGIVTALDITHDLRVGLDTWALAEHLRAQRDPRIKMIISNHRIMTVNRQPWEWRRYTQGNPHSHHLHVSCSEDPAVFDRTHEWALAFGAMRSEGDEYITRPVLRLGSRGAAVRDVQSALEIQVDGVFGPVTDAAVRAFQLEQQLDVDGRVGQRTWEKLDVIAEPD